MKSYEIISRACGAYAARQPLAKLAYGAGARVYQAVSHDRTGELRKQINISAALPAVWEGSCRYEQTYTTPRAPFRSVDMGVLLNHYDCFFLDIFGTYKDENGIWPQAAAVLQRIKDSGKVFIVVSNTTDYSAEVTLQQLRNAAINVGLDQIVTSGQVLRDLVEDMGLEGKRILNIGNNESRAYILQAGCIPVAYKRLQSQYDAILISFLSEPISARRLAVLEEKTRQGIPIILANSDKFLPLKSFLKENQAYRIAKDLSYQSKNRIFPVGKPHPSIYDEALRRLASARPGRILCIGDTLWTDIKGAHDFQQVHPELQLDSLLLLSGTERRVHHFPNLLLTYMSTIGVYPTYVLPRLELPAGS